ncbi:MAG TPA: alkaline phosphatase family protein, partial [Thermoanaerobaculia bacterium]|nr:alkaline phosphatase family protein [Thermoanaerobaculia bacterium]
MSERAFDHVVIIMFENEYRNYVRENSYMRSLAASGIDMSTYFGVMHPSNTNYVASVAGETCGITEDPNYNTLEATPAPPGYPMPAFPGPTPLTQLTVADRIHQKGLDWRAYMESYYPIDFPPQLDCVMESDGKTINQVETAKKTILDYIPYYNAHNPFVRFQSIFGNREQWERIGTIYDFLRDCLNGTLPEYSWITPSVWSDGHWMQGSYADPNHRAPDLIDQLAKWLRTFFSALNFPGPHSRLPRKTLVVVTFDEAEFDLDYQNVNNFGSDYDGPNQIYTVLLGDTIRPGRIDQEGYNHYSLLKTVEKNFGLDSLGKNDAEANWFRFL